MTMHPHEIEEMEYRFGPKLWDADPDVCCAAFQLGACEHTEADAWDYEDDMSDAELAEFREAELAPVARVVASDEEEPF